MKYDILVSANKHLGSKISSRENTYFVGFLNPTHSYTKAATKLD
jgi:hypothetical protein